MQEVVLKDSQKAMGRAHSIFKRLCFLALMCLGLSLFAQKIIDTDIWWHLSTGRYIAQKHVIPATDPFSYTAAGNEWIDLHWLFQVIVYGVYRTLGSYGLSLLFIVIYSATFFITWLTCRKNNSTLITFFFLWLGLMGTSSRFLARPEAFTYLMLALYMLILTKHEQGKAKSWIYLLIPLQVLWTNLQGLFILGPCLIFAFALKNRDRYYFSTLKKWYLSLFSRDESPDLSSRNRDGCYYFSMGKWYLSLFFMVFATVAASLINPYGLKGLLFPFVLFTRAGGIENIFAGQIAELQPPFSGYNLTTPLIFFGAFVAFCVVSLVLDWRNAKLSHIAIFLGMGYLALNARRNVPIFVFSALPLAVEHASSVVGRRRTFLNDHGWYFRRLNIAGYGVLLTAMVFQTLLVWNNSFYFSDKRAERVGFGFKGQTFPESAFTFIKREALDGPFFNSLDVGGMFMWEMYPEETVFVDPRLEVNSEKTFSEYCDVQSNPRKFEELTQKYGFNAAIITHTSPDGLYFVPIIYNTAGWTLVYLDPIAAVFARNIPVNEKIIEKNRIDIARAAVSPIVAESLNDTSPRSLKVPLDFMSSLAPSDSEAQNRFNLGLLYLVLGQNELAAEQLKAGLDLQPKSPEGYYNLGLAFYRMGRKETALSCFKHAIDLDGDYAAAHANLGRLYDEQGLKEDAEREYRLSLKWNGDNIIPLYNLGALYYEKGRYKDARSCWERILKKNPSFQPAQEAIKRLEGRES